MLGTALSGLVYFKTFQEVKSYLIDRTIKISA